MSRQDLLAPFFYEPSGLHDGKTDRRMDCGKDCRGVGVGYCKS